MTATRSMKRRRSSGASRSAPRISMPGLSRAPAGLLGSGADTVRHRLLRHVARTNHVGPDYRDFSQSSAGFSGLHLCGNALGCIVCPDLHLPVAEPVPRYIGRLPHLRSDLFCRGRVCVPFCSGDEGAFAGASGRNDGARITSSSAKRNSCEPKRFLGKIRRCCRPLPVREPVSRSAYRCRRRAEFVGESLDPANPAGSCLHKRSESPLGSLPDTCKGRCRLLYSC